jgi:protein-disulfide isomerase
MQKAIRIAAVVAVVGFLVALMIFNAGKGTDMKTWDAAMAKGDPKTAQHHFVMYTDIFCPYCDKFSDGVAAHLAEFDKDYIEDKKILFEIRVTDMNYESGHSNNSRPAGIAAYCTAKQNNFWDYYYNLLAKLYEDYHSKGIGAERDSPQHIPNLELDYFYAAAEGTSLNREQFEQCVANEETATELDNNTRRASMRISGLPYFVFDKYAVSGFAGNWDADNDWEQVKLMLNAGLTTK